MMVANRLRGEPSWWRNILVANGPDGKSSKRRNNLQDWGRNVQGRNVNCQDGKTSCYGLNEPL